VSAALAIDGVAIAFGGVKAVRGVSLEIAAGERRVIIGPNGAGKTTLFNLIAGQLRPDEGRVVLFGVDVTQRRAHERVRAGLARTFQISRLFPTLTVAENVQIATHGPAGFSPASFASPAAAHDLTERARELLETWGLAAESDELVANISHGNQRLLEIVMALATNPRVLLLDEPTAGLSSGERELVSMRLRALSRELTVILTDHDMDVVFDIADQIAVLNEGELAAHGTPDAIRADKRVHELYFGGDE
jgi:branched-chain amino acid transport system ATP-binding protein